MNYFINSSRIFNIYFRLFADTGEGILNTEYESYLFRKDKPSTFELPDQTLFTGIIRGVTDAGKLRVQMEDATKEFDLKELKLIVLNFLWEYSVLRFL